MCASVIHLESILFENQNHSLKNVTFAYFCLAASILRHTYSIYGICRPFANAKISGKLSYPNSSSHLHDAHSNNFQPNDIFKGVVEFRMFFLFQHCNSKVENSKLSAHCYRLDSQIALIGLLGIISAELILYIVLQRTKTFEVAWCICEMFTNS